MSSSIETEIPQWLNINFLEKHLRNYYENNEIKVHSFVVESATAAGENSFHSMINWVYLTEKSHDSLFTPSCIEHLTAKEIALEMN